MNIFIIILLLVSSFFLLHFTQQKMIYHPRPYDDTDLAQDQNLIRLPYSTSQGQQIAFYLPHQGGKTDEPPTNLWVLFGGNASLALDWLTLVHNYQDKNSGFLLVDYPGYGLCRGKASAKSILASSQAALVALADHLHTQPEKLNERISVLGHSLGAATALQFSTNHPIKRLVLIAPFTTLKDMGVIVVGRALAQLLIDNYDNRARLAELTGRVEPPAITLIHGTLDQVVPVKMGRDLAGEFPTIDYQEIVSGDHNLILTMEEKRIHQAMLGSQVPPK